MIRHLFFALGLGCALLAPLGQGAAAATPLAETISISVDPANVDVVLGENFDLTVTVSNDGTEPTPALVVHLDITDPEQTTSVDPEDWTPTLSQTIGPVGAGESITVSWNLQPISPGSFATYAVALSPGVDTIAASNVLQVNVSDQRTLNPGGILPVSLAAPSIVGVLLLMQMRFARKIRKSEASPLG
ncbi:MAG: hypothetical protein HKN03_05815 [Acidimicrobiales bacterium]|nr:hypothetical protein [Acidimicrobiales bacterium]